MPPENHTRLRDMLLTSDRHPHRAALQCLCKLPKDLDKMCSMLALRPAKAAGGGGDPSERLWEGCMGLSAHCVSRTIVLWRLRKATRRPAIVLWRLRKATRRPAIALWRLRKATRPAAPTQP